MPLSMQIMSDKEREKYVAEFLKDKDEFVKSLERLVNKYDHKNSNIMVCDLYTYREIYCAVKNMDYEIFENLTALARYIYLLDTAAIDRLPRKFVNFLEPLT